MGSSQSRGWKDRRGIGALHTGRDDWSSATSTNSMIRKGSTIDGRWMRVRLKAFTGRSTAHRDSRTCVQLSSLKLREDREAAEPYACFLRSL